MKKLLFFMFAMLVYPNLHAQKLQVRVDSLSVSIGRSDAKIENINKSIEELSKQVENLSYIVESQKDIIGQEQSTIENSMGAINTQLTVFSVLLAFGGIFLGVYINRKENNMQSLLKQVEQNKDEVEKLEEKTTKTKGEIEDLNDSINNDIERLYAKLRREETITLLKRLVYEPNDVVNLSTMLVSRDLETTDFKYLLVAYRKLKEENEPTDGGYIRIKYAYIVIFFQHFCGQSVLHELVKDDIISFFVPAMDCAFLNDIKNSTQSLIGCLNKSDAEKDKADIIFKYISALNESKYKTHNELYEMIVSKCKEDAVIQSVWIKLVAANVFIPVVGELLCKRFINDEGYIRTVQDCISELKKKQQER